MDNRLELVTFVGEALAPLFREDPKLGNAAPSLSAFAELDVDQAAVEWPFVDDDEAREALALMKNGLAEGICAEDLLWEFRRLFTGPFRRPCPPYGSVYMDRECVLFGLSMLDLRAWMRQHGIKRMSDAKTPDDEFGLMLLEMSWIAQEKPELLEEFLRLHLLTWSSHFLEQLEEAAEHDFYRGLAKLSRASLEGIQSAFDIQVDYPRFYR